jgi:hypothetical protein
MEFNKDRESLALDPDKQNKETDQKRKKWSFWMLLILFCFNLWVKFIY